MAHAEQLHRSLLKITDPLDLNRLPYGSVIVAGAVGCPGVYTLMKIDQNRWHSFTIFGNPSVPYEVEEEEEYTPDLPALLIVCGEELPEETHIRNFTLIKGGAEELDSQ